MSEAMRQAIKLRDFVRRGGDPKVWWESKEFDLVMQLEVELAYRELGGEE